MCFFVCLPFYRLVNTSFSANAPAKPLKMKSLFKKVKDAAVKKGKFADEICCTFCNKILLLHITAINI